MTEKKSRISVRLGDEEVGINEFIEGMFGGPRVATPEAAAMVDTLIEAVARREHALSHQRKSAQHDVDAARQAIIERIRGTR